MPQKSLSKKSFLKVFLLIFLVSCLLAILFLLKNYFIVKKINVNQPVRLIGFQDLYNKNIIFLNENYYEKALIQKNHEIKTIKIEKQLPETLILNIELDSIIAKIQADKGYFYLSEEGKIIKKSKEDLSQYPLINFYKKLYLNSYQAGEKIDFIDLKQALYLVDQLKEISLFPYHIDINKDNMIVFNIADKKIYFSFEKEIELQLYQLKEIVKNLKIKEEDFREIDLRFNKPILRY